jgi:regulator of protease activity HflC (stomatin/prohibitin superfamily)
VPPQDVITRDNVSLKISAVIYFRVVDAEKAIVAVQDYLYTTTQIAQTTLRSVLGQVELDDERERRAKVINAAGEFQAAAKLAEAARVLTRYPVAVQLRYLQPMREIASEGNSTSFSR